MVKATKQKDEGSLQAHGTVHTTQSIEEDYDNYKDQISEDTFNDNEEELGVLLRRPETQELFEGY